MTLSELADFLAAQPLLALAMGAILVHTLGAMVQRATPRLSGLLRGTGNLGLVAALLLTIAQVSRFTVDKDLALPQIGLPAQTVEGGETRVPLGADGHFWVEAVVNGEPRRFLVDTGATLTAISTETAARAAVSPRALRSPVLMRTANGTVRAELATIAELRFGNIVARDLDAVIAPNLGETNVLGMNLLRRLASWRVEGRTLILVPGSAEAGAQSSPERRGAPKADNRLTQTH